MNKKVTISSLGNIDTHMDWLHFREFVSNDIALEIEILSIFFDNVPEYIREIEASDDVHWPAACHKLKGAARAIGAWALAYQCELAESSIHTEQGSESRKNVIDCLNQNLVILRQEISKEHNAYKS